MKRPIEFALWVLTIQRSEDPLQSSNIEKSLKRLYKEFKKEKGYEG